MFEELLNVMLRDYIQSNRWFVEEEHFRRMQQCRNQLHFHPFAQR
jgi:hypothetical protein